jgi:hypothetical protein
MGRGRSGKPDGKGLILHCFDKNFQGLLAPAAPGCARKNAGMALQLGHSLAMPCASRLAFTLFRTAIQVRNKC